MRTKNERKAKSKLSSANRAQFNENMRIFTKAVKKAIAENKRAGMSEEGLFAQRSDKAKNRTSAIKDGIINPSASAPFGFTPDFFDGWLWKKGDAIIVSFIFSLDPGKGHFKRLVENILSSGFAVKIPTPLGEMARIVRKNGYVPTLEYHENYGIVALWTKHPSPADAIDQVVALTEKNYGPGSMKKKMDRTHATIGRRTGRTSHL
jgi:hypothetical protein